MEQKDVVRNYGSPLELYTSKCLGRGQQKHVQKVKRCSPNHLYLPRRDSKQRYTSIVLSKRVDDEARSSHKPR